MKFINGKVKAESTAMISDKNALEVMDEAARGNKISDNDYVTIYEECLAAVGINVRRGVLRSTDDKVKGKSYFIYHNGGMDGNGGSFRRSVCIDYLYYNPDGSIKRIVMTTKGVKPAKNSAK